MWNSDFYAEWNKNRFSTSIDLTTEADFWVPRDVISMNDQIFLIFKSWKTYIQLQEYTHASKVPNLELILYQYMRNGWLINDAWLDFQSIVRENANQIAWEAGEYVLDIPNFQISDFTYEIFRKIYIDMAMSLEIGTTEKIFITKNFVRRCLVSTVESGSDILCNFDTEESIETKWAPLSYEAPIGSFLKNKI